MKDGKAYSRPQAVAARLTGKAATDGLLDRPVLLTADASALLTVGGRSSFLAALSLLTRFCVDLSVCIPDAVIPFESEARSLADRIRHAGNIRLLRTADAQLEQYRAILNIGTTVRSGLPWTAVACDGWVFQVCSEQGRIVRSVARFNPATTRAAASLGAAEVFKRLLGVSADVAPPLQDELFSLLTYSTDADTGPEIRSPLRLDCILIGAGAIGNGIRHVLLELPVEGWLAVVDRQEVGEENWGTYIGLAPDGFDKPKVDLACAGWSPAVRPIPLPIDVAELVPRLGSEMPFPDVTLGALDNIEARHEVQRIWPDVAIDGAIGDVTCQVSRHPWGPDTACLECMFRASPGEDAAVLASRVTGLSVESVKRQEEVVTQTDIDAATGEHKAWLAARKGHQKCSVIREALAAKLSDGKVTFSPSAPFVACMSASMVAAEFIKLRMGLDSPLDPRFQFDVLRGPSAGSLLEQARRKDCFCVQRANVVERFRSRR